MRTVLELSEVSKRYRRGPLVLEDVSLTVEPGTLTQIRGGNGSGKSTLLRIAGGFSRPTTGRVHRNAARLGFAPDRALPPARMTAREYLQHLGRLAGMPASAISGEAEAITERLGLSPGLDAPLGTLSRGNQRKVLLAQALMRPADLVVLDEPFTALDLEAAAALTELLRERVERGSALLVAVHGTELGRDGRVLALASGQLVDAPADGETRLVIIELGGPQPPWTPGGEPLLDGRVRYLVPEAERESLLAGALAAGAKVLRVAPHSETTPNAEASP